MISGPKRLDAQFHIIQQSRYKKLKIIAPRHIYNSILFIDDFSTTQNIYNIAILRSNFRHYELITLT